MLPVTFTQVKVLMKNSLQPLNVHWESFYLKVIICWIEQLTTGKDKKKTKGTFYLSELRLARPFSSYWKFHFLSKLSSQISQILNSMHEGDDFSAKTLWKKPISFANWLIRQWSGQPVLTNGKCPKVAIGLK